VRSLDIRLYSVTPVGGIFPAIPSHVSWGFDHVRHPARSGSPFIHYVSLYCIFGGFLEKEKEIT